MQASGAKWTKADAEWLAESIEDAAADGYPTVLLIAFKGEVPDGFRRAVGFEISGTTYQELPVAGPDDPDDRPAATAASYYIETCGELGPEPPDRTTAPLAAGVQSASTGKGYAVSTPLGDIGHVFSVHVYTDWGYQRFDGYCPRYGVIEVDARQLERLSGQFANIARLTVIAG